MTISLTKKNPYTAHVLCSIQKKTCMPRKTSWLQFSSRMNRCLVMHRGPSIRALRFYVWTCTFFLRHWWWRTEWCCHTIFGCNGDFFGFVGSFVWILCSPCGFMCLLLWILYLYAQVLFTCSFVGLHAVLFVFVCSFVWIFYLHAVSSVFSFGSCIYMLKFCSYAVRWLTRKRSAVWGIMRDQFKQIFLERYLGPRILVPFLVKGLVFTGCQSAE